MTQFIPQTPLTPLHWVVGIAAIVAPALHSLSDLMEWMQGGLSPAQLWVTYAAFLPMPWLLLGIFAVHDPMPKALGLAGALLYGAAFSYFTHSALYALAEGMVTYEVLWARLGGAYTFHGGLMVLGGGMFAFEALRARWLPRFALLLFGAGLAANLVLALLPTPDILQIVGSAMRNLGLIAMGCTILLRRADLRTDYDRLLHVATNQPPSAPLAVLREAEIATLPASVQRYLRVSGAVGRLRVRELEITYDAAMFSQPGQRGMPGPAAQFDRVDPPQRFFFMRTRMFGLPVAVLHVYEDARASMTVRLASLFNVVDVHSDDLARSETVTLLNDLCFFAPSALVDPRFTWRTIDEHQVEVTFSNGPHRVAAILVFDAAGDLVNFISEDRGQLQNDGTFKRFRWSTPMRHIREFQGRRVPTRGEAIWHQPQGDFVYGRFVLKSISFGDEPAAPGHTPSPGDVQHQPPPSIHITKE